MADEQHNAAFMVGIVLGAVGGAVGTLLLTPLSGKQTREQLGARTGGLVARGGIPDHLDSGSYADLDRANRQPAQRPMAVSVGSAISTLRERVQGAINEGGAIAALQARARSLVPTGITSGADGAAERGEVRTGEVITFVPTLPDDVRRDS